MFKKYLLPAALALVVGAAPAKAANVLFNPAGGGVGGALTIDQLDPAVGNSIVLNLNAGSGVGSVGTSIFQANLSAANLLGAQQFANGGGGNFFTIVAGFKETVISNVAGTVQLQADFTSGAANYFKIYHNNVAGNDLTGVCFTCGTVVMAGQLVFDPQASGKSVFTVTDATGSTVLDNFAGNDYVGTNSLRGIGAFDVALSVTSVDANYFPNFVLGSKIVLATSEEKLNYTTANPSSCFSTNGIALVNATCSNAGNQAGVGSVGTVNLLNGANSMFQTDSSLSFTAPQVPEPASLALLGLGLAGSAMAIRRRNRVNN